MGKITMQMMMMMMVVIVELMSGMILNKMLMN